MSDFKVLPDTVKGLDLAIYVKKAELNTDHKQLILMVAKMLLAKVSYVKPSEIMSDSTILLKLMRDDYVSQNSRIETLEIRI